MARLDSSEFQQLTYEGLHARARSTEFKALAILVLDGLLVGILTIGSTLRGEQTKALAPALVFSLGGLGVVTLVVLLLACLCVALTLRTRGDPLVLGQPSISSYDEYLQAVRRLTGDAVLEELARQTWEEQQALQGKQVWLSAALVLTLAGLLLFGLFNLPVLFPRP